MTLISRNVNIGDGVMYVYGRNNNSCNDLYYVTCEDDNANGNMMPVVTVYGNPGEVVYVRLFGFNGSVGSLEIAAVNYYTSGLQGGGSENNNFTITPEEHLMPIEDGVYAIKGKGQNDLPAAQRTQTEVAASDLFSSSPNPLNAQAEIRFSLNASALVGLQVWDLSGNLIAEPIAGKTPLDAGNYTHLFDGTQLPNGMYIALLNINGERKMHKMMVVHPE